MRMKKCSKCGYLKLHEAFYTFKGKAHGTVCKECKKSYSRMYHQMHRDKILPRAKSYRAQHKHEISDGKKRCYQRRKEHYIQKAREWTVTHRAAKRVIGLRYMRNHPEKRIETQRRMRRDLMPSYVKYVIRKGTMLRNGDIPSSLVEAKREHIKLRRVLHEQG